jgi:hypothetical protein
LIRTSRRFRKKSMRRWCRFCSREHTRRPDFITVNIHRGVRNGCHCDLQDSGLRTLQCRARPETAKSAKTARRFSQIHSARDRARAGAGARAEAGAGAGAGAVVRVWAGAGAREEPNSSKTVQMAKYAKRETAQSHRLDPRRYLAVDCGAEVR